MCCAVAYACYFCCCLLLLLPLGWLSKARGLVVRAHRHAVVSWYYQCLQLVCTWQWPAGSSCALQDHARPCSGVVCWCSALQVCTHGTCTCLSTDIGVPTQSLFCCTCCCRLAQGLWHCHTHLEGCPWPGGQVRRQQQQQLDAPRLKGLFGDAWI
jgi:hypothetical protein